MSLGSATALATVLSGMLALLAVVIWPGFLERHLSLDWRIGNVRAAAYALQAAFAATAVVVAVARRWIGAHVARGCTSPRTWAFPLITCAASALGTLVLLEGACRVLDLPVRFRVPAAASVAA